jgi:hypothetical protein
MCARGHEASRILYISFCNLQISDQEIHKGMCEGSATTGGGGEVARNTPAGPTLLQWLFLPSLQKRSLPARVYRTIPGIL